MIHSSHTMLKANAQLRFGAQSNPSPLRSVPLPDSGQDNSDSVEIGLRPSLVSVSDDMADSIIEAQQASSDRKRKGNIITGTLAGLFALLATFVGIDTLEQHGARAEAMTIQQDAENALGDTQADIQNLQTQLEVQPQVEDSLALASTALADAQLEQTELETQNAELDDSIAFQEKIDSSLTVPLEQGQVLFNIENNPVALPAQELAELNDEAIVLLGQVDAKTEAIQSLEAWYVELAEINARAAEQTADAPEPAETDIPSDPVGVPAPDDSSNNDAVTVPPEQEFEECVDDRGGIIGTVDKWLFPPAC